MNVFVAVLMATAALATAQRVRETKEEMRDRLWHDFQAAHNTNYATPMEHNLAKNNFEEHFERKYVSSGGRRLEVFDLGREVDKPVEPVGPLPRSVAVVYKFSFLIQKTMKTSAQHTSEVSQFSSLLQQPAVKSGLIKPYEIQSSPQYYNLKLQRISPTNLRRQPKEKSETNSFSLPTLKTDRSCFYQSRSGGDARERRCLLPSEDGCLRLTNLDTSSTQLRCISHSACLVSQKTLNTNLWRLECCKGRLCNSPAGVVTGSFSQLADPIYLGCAAPPIVLNAQALRGGNFPLGRRLNYKCLEGYRLRGNPAVTCHPGGWTKPPICQMRFNAEYSPYRGRYLFCYTSMIPGHGVGVQPCLGNTAACAVETTAGRSIRYCTQLPACLSLSSWHQRANPGLPGTDVRCCQTPLCNH